jgi:molecular chaperone GrpE
MMTEAMMSNEEKNINEEATQPEVTAEQETAAENTAEQTAEEAVKPEAELEKNEQTVEELLEAAKAESKANFDKYLRQLSEFENFRKRSNIEKAAMYSNGVRDTVEKLLPVIDNFERAVDAFEDKESSMYEGVAMIQKQFLEIIAALGVEEIAAEGEPFDPNVHAAVMHIEDEKCDENVVVEVFQKGYKLGDRVIRPAMVKVAN